jgi:uncharacterized SAM-binding protein YcdF (DUF218 family)
VDLMKGLPSLALRWVARLLACIGFVLVAVTLIPSQWYAGFLTGPWTEPRGNVLVILGSDALENGSLGESTFWRCVFAADVWRDSEFKHLIVSGDSVTTSAMRDYLVWRGIPSEAILIEDRSYTTRQNALNTAKLTAGMSGPFVLLTSDFHMWRASRTFAKAGMSIQSRPCPDAFKRSRDWRNRWSVFLTLTQEVVKIGYYRLRGWI